MIINDEHIKEAENLLIGGQEFDKKERVPFIKNLESLDLLAVPGSGKTTALIAKLYCLSKNLPFNDGSGILVLSHTNAAVDEIEKHLKPVCPKLFEYPNFIGTVQSFTNQFLAKHACFLTYGTYLNRIDDELANKFIKNKIERLEFGNQLSTYFFFQTYNQYSTITQKLLLNEYSLDAKEAKKIVDQLRGIGIIENGSLKYEKIKNEVLINALPIDEATKSIIKSIHKKAKKLTDSEKNKRGALYKIDFVAKHFSYQQNLSFESNSGQTLKIIFDNIFSKGLARFKDCYSFATYLLAACPEVGNVLNKRFKFVFIDEMQDLEMYQIDLIDRIFKTEDSATIIQRIGDINQSIYNSGKKVKSEADWQPRNEMYLNNSNRLTPEIARIVNCFTLDRQKDEQGNSRFIVTGLRKIDNPIKPHLIVFNKASMEKLENTFSDLISKHKLESLPEATKYGFKIVGWNAKWDDDEDHQNKIRLENIFSRYKKATSGSRETFDSLSTYLQVFNRSKKTLEPARKAILNAIIAVLISEGKTYKATIRGKVIERFYSKHELINEIKRRQDPFDYDTFKLNLYEWSFQLMAEEKYEEVYYSIKKFIQNKLKEWFELLINKESINFLGEKFVKINVNLDDYVEDPKMDVKIDIGTVHSAKGETHCATMYIETSYHDYETNKLRVVTKIATKTKAEVVLPNPLFGKEHTYREGKDSRAKESLKMMYVGFSRPTHLLCFAALKENVGESLEEYSEAGWEIIDLTT